MEKGALYVVSTPIGNLSDMTYRAIETLQRVDYIVVEDTRIASRLLNHYKIKKPLITYRDSNKINATNKILDLLSLGNEIALTSDAGTPTISDPGFNLVKQVISERYKVYTIPGPSAVTSALSVSGLPTDKFTFVGFLARKGGDRTETIRKFGELDATLIIYESPFRVVRTLKDILEILGDRHACVSKELTKVYESHIYGTISSILLELEGKTLKGEHVILIAKENYSPDKKGSDAKATK